MEIRKGGYIYEVGPSYCLGHSICRQFEEGRERKMHASREKRISIGQYSCQSSQKNRS